MSVEFPDDGFDDGCARCHMTPSDRHLESVAGDLVQLAAENSKSERAVTELVICLFFVLGSFLCVCV